MIGLVLNHWKKGSIIIVAVLLFFLFKQKKKEKPMDLTNKNPFEKRAYFAALQLRSALGTNGGFWSWTEDEKAVIEVMNANTDIISLVQSEYYELTKSRLFDDISKYLSPKDIAKINYTIKK